MFLQAEEIAADPAERGRQRGVLSTHLHADGSLGDLLFVDADTGGVFAYCHDGMDVEPWAGSLAELLAGSRDQAGDDDAESDAASDGGRDGASRE